MNEQTIHDGPGAKPQETAQTPEAARIGDLYGRIRDTFMKIDGVNEEYLKRCWGLSNKDIRGPFHLVSPGRTNEYMFRFNPDKGYIAVHRRPLEEGEILQRDPDPQMFDDSRLEWEQQVRIRLSDKTADSSSDTSEILYSGPEVEIENPDHPKNVMAKNAPVCYTGTECLIGHVIEDFGVR